MWKWGYIRWLGHSHFHCYAWQKQWGLVAAGVGALEEAKQRSLSRQQLWNKRLMRTLDPKTFSSWTVTHSYDTARGMPSWALLNTVNTFTRRPCILKHKTFHEQKIYLTTLQKKKKLMFASFLVFCPTLTTKARYTHCWQLVFGHFIHHKLLYTSFISVVHVCLHDTAFTRDIIEIISTRESWRTIAFGAQLVFWHKWLSCITQPWCTSVIC